MMHLPCLISISVALLPLVVDANCWLQNQTDRNVAWGYDRYVPCDTNIGETSMCCATNGGGDVCRNVTSNAGAALCYNKGTNNLWRESCTDKSWASPSCLKLFLNVSDTDILVTDCAANGLGNGFCYGKLNLDCCRTGLAVFIDPTTGEQVATDPTLTTSPTTSTSASSSTSSTSSTSSPTTTSSTSSGISTPVNQTPTGVPASGLSTGAKAGIGVGVALGVLLLLGAGAFFLTRRRRNARQAPPGPNVYRPVPSAQNEKLEMPTASEKPQEMAHSYRAGSEGFSELAGQNVSSANRMGPRLSNRPVNEMPG